MAPPTSYTEDTLATFMLADLKDVATVLGWSTQASVQVAIDDVVLQLGISDIATATNIPQVRALARVFAWKLAVKAASAYYAFSADGGSFSREQLQAMCRQGLALSEMDAIPWIDSAGLKTYNAKYAVEQDRNPSDI